MRPQSQSPRVSASGSSVDLGRVARAIVWQHLYVIHLSIHDVPVV